MHNRSCSPKNRNCCRNGIARHRCWRKRTAAALFERNPEGAAAKRDERVVAAFIGFLPMLSFGFSRRRFLFSISILHLPFYGCTLFCRLLSTNSMKWCNVRGVRMHTKHEVKGQRCDHMHYAPSVISKSKTMFSAKTHEAQHGDTLGTHRTCQ